MADHPTAALVRERFGSADPEEMAEWLADDVVWHQIGGDTLHGKQSVIDSMSGVEGVEFSLDLHDVVANDDHTIALVEASIDTGDQSFSYRTAEIYHFNEDGKISERWAFSDDTQAITDFFGQFG